MENLRALLRAIDRKSYKAYKSLQGRYAFPGYTLIIDHVQGDPFAAPSRLRVQVANAGFPSSLYRTFERRRACEDFVRRAAAGAIKSIAKGTRGSGRSGEIAIERGGQQVLLRNAVQVRPEHVEARLTLGLPAAGRTVLAAEAEAMLFDELPRIVEQSLLYPSLPDDALQQHVASVEDQVHLRDGLEAAGLVAFVADGALLPRQSGIDDRPLVADVVPFSAPASLSVTVTLPNAGELRGLGIPRGITLIVGGGFHGKSTLLHALERGIYDHIPGDGREQVATDPTAVKVRAEDGRSISRVNISSFIDRLPFGRDTKCFSTQNASGSTSQAANIIEALETGARLLLIDEDTSSTNFMIRDARMQQLVTADKEPITPFLQRARELYERHGVSSVIVMGGSGDYFSIADTVVMMDNYVPKDVSAQAHALAGSAGFGSDLPPVQWTCPRRPGPSVLDGSRGRHEVRIDTHGTRELVYGEHVIDLTKVEQLVDVAQCRAIGWIIHRLSQSNIEGRDLSEALREVFHQLEEHGLDAVTPYKLGTLALPRLHEVAAAINRIREGSWLEDPGV